MRFQRLAFFTALTLGITVVLAGCQNQDSSVSQSQFQEVTVEVLGMGCAEGCAPRVQEALVSLPWAKNVKVHFEAKQATLTAEKARYDESALLKALKDEEFDAKVLAVRNGP